MTERLDNAAEAQRLMAVADNKTKEAAAVLVAAAQVRATLALVEQKRIANLIALGSYRLGPGEYPVFRHLVVEPKGEYDVAPVQAIREGLDLSPKNTNDGDALLMRDHGDRSET